MKHYLPAFKNDTLTNKVITTGILGNFHNLLLLETGTAHLCSCAPAKGPQVLSLAAIKTLHACKARINRGQGCEW
jgi:hypothetical protein